MGIFSHTRTLTHQIPVPAPRVRVFRGYTPWFTAGKSIPVPVMGNPRVYLLLYTV